MGVSRTLAALFLLLGLLGYLEKLLLLSQSQQLVSSTTSVGLGAWSGFSSPKGWGKEPWFGASPWGAEWAVQRLRPLP